MSTGDSSLSRSRSTRKALSYPLALSVALLPGTVAMLAFVWLSSGVSASRRVFTLFDDAMISMSFARTLASTGEWTWYPGAERVQGFTNPLWTIYMAALHWMGLQGSNAALAVNITGVVTTLLISIVTAGVVRTATSGWPFSTAMSIVCASVIPFLAPLVFWSVRGMEVGFLALLAIVVTRLTMLATDPIRPTRIRSWAGAAAGVLCTLGVATRLDFALVALCAAGWTLWVGRRDRTSLQAGVLMTASVVISVALVLGFQRYYWGDALPNTYHLKIDGFTVVERLGRGSVNLMKSLPLIALALVSMWFVYRATDPGSRVRRITDLLALTVLIAALYSLWAGGDAWEWSMLTNRYISVGLPSAAALIAVGGLGAISSLHRREVSPIHVVGLLIITSACALGAAALTNPYQLDVTRGALLTLIMGAIVVLFAGVFAAMRQHDQRESRPLVLGVGMLVLLVASTSVLPIVRSLVRDHDVGPLVRADFEMVATSKLLPEVALPDARIATVWAGAPGYFAQRPMIDLLGKSDRVVARGVPRSPSEQTIVSTFFPGHNKWDYEYSIGTLKPDLVFQLWFPEDSDFDALARWGYVKRCLPNGHAVWALGQSGQLRWDKLAPCP